MDVEAVGVLKDRGVAVRGAEQQKHVRMGCLTDLQHYTGSWPVLVKRGGLEVLHRFSVQRMGGKTASFLREEPSISLSEVPALSTSPNMAKSHEMSKFV
jgi:hypothetical protein